MPRPDEIRRLLRGGDRRSIADSNRVRGLVEANPALVDEVAILTDDPDPLVVQRALDLLEKLAHHHPEWVEPHKTRFIPGAEHPEPEQDLRLPVLQLGRFTR